MDIKAIPKEMLIHSATVIGESEEDKWGDTIPGENTELKHVRFEPSSAIKQSSNDVNVDYASLLFFDYQNSEPSGFKFEKGMQINFELLNVTMQVHKVDTVYAVDTHPHHYEVYLI